MNNNEQTKKNIKHYRTNVHFLQSENLLAFVNILHNHILRTTLLFSLVDDITVVLRGLCPKKQISYAYILPLVFNAEYNQFRQYSEIN